MEVHFSPETQARLEQLASDTGQQAEQIVQTTVALWLDDRARFIAGVQRGIEQADRGETISHEEVRQKIDSLFQP